MSEMQGSVVDDDLDMEDWMSLTDEQQEAKVRWEMDNYIQWYASLNLANQVAHRRYMALSNCRSLRRLIRLSQCPCVIRDEAHTRLRAAQVRLLKLRIWRATGVQPGEA